MTVSPIAVPRVRGLLSEKRLQGIATSNALLIGLIVLAVFFATQSDRFASVDNIRNILVQAAVPVVIAIPFGLLLMSGEIDLSVGSNVGLSGVMAGLCMTSWDLSWPIAVVVGIAVGMTVGAVNGALVSSFAFSSLIVTLGGLAAIRGLAQVASPGAVYDFPSAFVTFGNGEVLGVPYLVLCAAAVVLLGWIVLNLSPLGLHLRAVGVSREAAYLSGVRTKSITFALFVAVGAASGLGGLMFAARLNSAPATSLGVNLELDVLTAVLLGGIALGGGKGTIRGLVFGVLFLAVLANGMTLLNVPPAWAVTAKGLALVVAAFLDWLSRRSS